MPSSPASCACRADHAYSRMNQPISSGLSTCGAAFMIGMLRRADGACGTPAIMVS
jgi:hypothetical protein